MNVRRPLHLALAVALLLAACGGAPKRKLTRARGDQQQATVGTAVATAPTVKLVDEAGKPAAGVPVRFAILAGGGQVEGATPVTNADGLAWPGGWTLGVTAGKNQLRATAAGVHVDFTATATPGAPARVAPAGGVDTVQAALGSTTEVAFVVTDAHGNAVADGTAVSFSVDSGDATLAATSADTAGGRASVAVDNPGLPGTTVVRATVGPLSATVTVARVTGAPAVITAEAPYRVLEVGTPTTFSVSVADSAGLPVDTTVSFSVDGAAPVAVPAPAGQASLRLAAPTVAGTHEVEATAPGGASATFTVITSPGPRRGFSILFGDGVLVEGGSYPFVAAGTDAYGNQVPGGLTFTLFNSNNYVCSLHSNGDGVYVWTANHGGSGSYGIGLGGGCGTGDAHAFRWSPITHWPGQLTLTPTDGATVAAGSTTAVTLTALDGGTPPGPTPVTFLLYDGEGDFGHGVRKQVVTTDPATGEATVDLSVGDTPGPRKLLVHFPGQPPLLRTLQVPLPQTESLVRRSPETKAVLFGDGDSVAVQVLDPTGTAVSGEAVVFEVEGGTLDGGQVPVLQRTSGSGVAQVSVGAEQMGLVTVTATLEITGQRLSFTRSFGAGSPAAVRLSDQDHSAVDPGTERPLVATVTDRNGNPVADAPVDFHVLGQGSITGPRAGVTGADGTASTTWRTPATAGQEVKLVASVDPGLQGTSLVRTVAPPAVAAGTRIPLALPVGSFTFVPGSHLALFHYDVTFSDGVSRPVLVRIDPANRTAADLNPGQSWTSLGAFMPTADGTRMVAAYGGDAGGLAVIDTATGDYTAIPLPGVDAYDLQPAAEGATVFVTANVPTTRPKCGKDWVATRETRRYAVDLGAAHPSPTLVDTFQTSGSGCNDAAVGHYGPSAACDGAYYVTYAGHLEQLAQGQVTRLQNGNAAGLEAHVDAQGACEVSYVNTSTHALMQVAFDASGTFAPTVIHDVTGHLFDLYRPADGFLLDAVARGALTLDGTPAGSSTALGPAPFAGNVGTPVLLPGDQQAVFQSKLLRQHDELWLADLANGGTPRRISQYLPDAGPERDVKAWALWPDGQGLVFLQSADGAGTNVRPYAVTFASVPATEADGPAATAFGFGDLSAPAFSVADETVTDMSLGGNRYAAFVGDARAIDAFELYVVDRASGATVPLATLPGPRYPAPAWSDDGEWLAYQTGDTGAVTLVDVPGRIAELAAP